MMYFLVTIAIVMGACIGAVAYQQYLLTHPNNAQEICKISK